MYCGGSYESSSADTGGPPFPEKKAQKRENDMEGSESMDALRCNRIDRAGRSCHSPSGGTCGIYV